MSTLPLAGVVVVGTIVVVVGVVVVVGAAVVVGSAAAIDVTGGVLASAELHRRNVADPVTRPPTNTTTSLNDEVDTVATRLNRRERYPGELRGSD
jgi:hypothetical protein